MGFLIIIAILVIWALISDRNDSAKRKRKEEQEKALFQRAKLAESNSRYEEAAQLYTDLIQDNPKSTYYNNRAYDKGQIGDVSGEIIDYTHAIVLNDSDDLYYFNRGITFWNNDHDELALFDLSKSSKLSNSEATEIIERDYVVSRTFTDFRKSLNQLKLHSKLGFTMDTLGSEGDESWTWTEETTYPIIFIPQELKKLLVSKISAKTNNDESKPEFMIDSLMDAHHAILNYLLKTNCSTYSEDNPRKGTSENFFHSYLKKEFGNQIIINQLFDYYHPDFVLKHSLTNLTIDIEIDEPYGIESKEMYHGSTKLSESKRNSHFLSNRWIIIRFAEEQVLLHPEKCCNLIGAFLYLLTYDSSNNNAMNFPPPVKRWQQGDKELIDNKYRETYIRKWKANNGKN